MAGKLLQDFGSPEAIFRASLTAWESKRLPAAVAQAIHTRPSLSAASKELAQVQAVGSHLVTWDESSYPQRLGEIYDPPPLLYVRGNVQLLSRHTISVVGSRRPTPYGNQMAQRLAKLWPRNRKRIGSGIDCCAHKRALSSDTGSAIRVWGCGIDLVYPKENRKSSTRSHSAAQLSRNFQWGLFQLPRTSRFATASSQDRRWVFCPWKARSTPDR
jgi:DNA processing protein